MDGTLFESLGRRIRRRASRLAERQAIQPAIADLNLNVAKERVEASPEWQSDGTAEREFRDRKTASGNDGVVLLGAQLHFSDQR